MGWMWDPHPCEREPFENRPQRKMHNENVKVKWEKTCLKQPNLCVSKKQLLTKRNEEWSHEKLEHGRTEIQNINRIISTNHMIERIYLKVMF